MRPSCAEMRIKGEDLSQVGLEMRYTTYQRALMLTKARSIKPTIKIRSACGQERQSYWLSLIFVSDSRDDICAFPASPAGLSAGPPELICFGTPLRESPPKAALIWPTNFRPVGVSKVSVFPTPETVWPILA